MRKTVLFDTNAIIALEDTGRELPEKYARMLRLAVPDHAFFFHPLSLEDIDNDKDEERKRILTSRTKQFSMLEDPPSFQPRDFEDLGWRNKDRNDEIDNNLLGCVLRGAVHYLVTDDKRIHANARNAGISPLVMTLSEFCEYADDETEPPELAVVQKCKCHTLDKDDPFFDSLRETYEGFDDWLVDNCMRGQRDCLVIKSDEGIHALCIIKQERNMVIDDEGFCFDGEMLKLCTFKVASEHFGLKMGERLLFAAIQYACASSAKLIYLTANEERQGRLIDFALDFGFEKKGFDTKTGDRVLCKYLAPQNKKDHELPKADYCRRFYPSFKNDSTVSKYLVPIQPQWHERLFPDISNFRGSLFGNFPEFYSSESNTIRKVYICSSQTSSIEPGDLLLFYRSEDRRSVQVLGAVTSVSREYDEEKVINMVHKRTVYSSDEIRELAAASKRGLLVIFFDVINYFDNEVHLGDVKCSKLAAPISIYGLSDEVFEEMVVVGNGD